MQHLSKEIELQKKKKYINVKKEKRQEREKHSNKICQRNIVFVAVETRLKVMFKCNQTERNIIFTGNHFKAIK